MSETGRAPKRSVLKRFVRSTSFSGVAVPMVMIVVPPQIGSWMRRGRDDAAIERDRSGLLNVRRREVAPDLAAPVGQGERDTDLVALADVGSDAPGLDLASVEELADGALLEEWADVLVVGQLLAHRVDELELAGRADQVAHLLLVADAGNLDHDQPRTVAGRLRTDLRLADTDAGDAPFDRVARELHLLVGDRLVALLLHLERHAQAALEVESEHGPELGPAQRRRAASRGRASCAAGR